MTHSCRTHVLALLVALTCFPIMALAQKSFDKLAVGDFQEAVRQHLSRNPVEKTVLEPLVDLDPSRISYQPAGDRFGVLAWTVKSPRPLSPAKTEQAMDHLLKILADAIGQGDPQLLSQDDYNAVFENGLPRDPNSVVVKIAQTPQPPSLEQRVRRLEQDLGTSQKEANSLKKQASGFQSMITQLQGRVGTLEARDSGGAAPQIASSESFGPSLSYSSCPKLGWRRWRAFTSCWVSFSECCETGLTPSIDIPETVQKAPSVLHVSEVSSKRLGSSWLRLTSNARQQLPVHATSASLSSDVVEAGDSEGARMYFGFAYHAYWKGDYEEVVRQTNKGLALDNRAPRLWYYKGLAELAMGRQSAAEASLARAVSLHAVAGPRQRSAVYRSLGRLQGALRLELDTAMQLARAKAATRSTTESDFDNVALSGAR